MIILKSIIVPVTMLTLYILEKTRSFKQSKYGYNLSRLLTNLGFWLINSLIYSILIGITAYFASGFFDWRTLLYSFESLTWYQASLLVLIDIVIIDCFIYFWHRLNHEIPFLWRFHQVHHSDEELDFTSGVRFHFGEVTISAFFRLVLILLFDIPLVSVLIAETALVLFSLFQHSNIKLSTKFEYYVSKIFVTPGIHWIHHHKDRQDTDSNYGNIFSFWDPLFKSRSKHRRFSGMPIGISGFLSPKKMLDLIILPFKG